MLISRSSCVLLIAVVSMAVAQTPATPAKSGPPKLELRGDRFKPLTYEQLTPAQKTMIDHLLAGDRGGTTTGPFNVLLRSPEMGDLAQQFGAQMRYHSSIPRKLNEFAILITARHWTSQYEWYAHQRDGLKYGLEGPVIDSLAAGKRPAPMSPDEEIVYNFCNELLHNQSVSDPTYARTLAKFGDQVLSRRRVSKYFPK